MTSSIKMWVVTVCAALCLAACKTVKQADTRVIAVAQQEARATKDSSTIESLSNFQSFALEIDDLVLEIPTYHQFAFGESIAATDSTAVRSPNATVKVRGRKASLKMQSSAAMERQVTEHHADTLSTMTRTQEESREAAERTAFGKPPDWTVILLVLVVVAIIAWYIAHGHQ